MKSWNKSMKHILRKAVNTIGYDIVRYQAEQSRFYRIQRLLISHEIDLVLDVGANVGQYARFIRQTGYSGRIVSFEPLSSAYRQLQKNKDSDSLWSIAPQAAIGDVEGKIKLNIAKNSFSSSVLDMLDAHIEAAPASSYIGSEIVSMNRLDSIAGPFITEGIRNVFLKIDAQGFEKQVLRGAEGILPRIMGIQIELSLVALYKGQALLREMLDMMDILGYDLHDVNPAFADENSGRVLQIDGIFFKR